MAMTENGTAKFGHLIDQNIAQAKYLSDKVESTPELELVAPTALNIVCFRHRIHEGTETQLKDLNLEIVLRLQESGMAVPSDTTVAGKHCLRVAINNHRTRREDLDLLLAEVVRLGREIHSHPVGSNG